MISKIGIYSQPKISNREFEKATPSITASRDNVVAFKGANISNDKFSNALRALNDVKLASSVSFGNSNIFDALGEAATLTSCKDPDLSLEGEKVGSRIDVNNVIETLKEHFQDIDGNRYPAVKTDTQVDKDNVYRTQLKKLENGAYYYNMRQFEKSARTNQFVEGGYGTQSVSAVLTEGTPEEVAFLETKGSFTPTIRDGNNVMLISDGQVRKKSLYGTLSLTKRDGSKIAKAVADMPNEKIQSMLDFQLSTGKVQELSKATNGNLKEMAKIALTTTFEPSAPVPVPALEIYEQKPSSSKGGTVVIGLQEGRFCKELVQSLVNFEKKIKSGEINLPTFKPQEGAKDMRILMLAGGFGSRAEYTNASSDAIFKNDHTLPDGTKGSFTLPTGLTPMESSLVTLHLAGILNCSQNYFEIGKNLKFYMNAHKEGENRGNGGFTIDMNRRLNGDDVGGRVNGQFQFVMSNDALLRMPEAIKNVTKIMRGGNASVAMIAKEVSADEARGNFGIMKTDSEGEIKAFAEKPKDDKTLNEFKNQNGMELVNTFQFAVSPEALDALEVIMPSFRMPEGSKKDALDWSSHFISSLILLSRCGNKDEAIAALPELVGKMVTPKADEYIVDSMAGVVYSLKDPKNPEKIMDMHDDQSTTNVKFEGARYLVNKKTGTVANLDAGTISNGYLNFLTDLKEEDFQKAKVLLKDQKVYAVPSNELWFDVGQLPDLYKAVTSIVKDTDNKYNMLSWERRNAVLSTNLETGLMASNPQQRKEIEEKYSVKGQVFATPKAQAVENNILIKQKDNIIARNDCKSLH